MLAHKKQQRKVYNHTREITGEIDYDILISLPGYSGEAERSFRREAEGHSGTIPNTIGA